MPEEIQKVCAADPNAPFCRAAAARQRKSVQSKPEANAKACRIAAGGALVILDGSGSSDKDGDISSFQWAQTGGSPVNIIGRDREQASFVAPDDSPGPEMLIFELTVTDSRGEFDTDKCIVELW